MSQRPPILGNPSLRGNSWNGNTNRRALGVRNANIDPETGFEIPLPAEIQASLDLPPEFQQFLTKYPKENGFDAAIKWYQTQLTASDVKGKDTAGFTDLEEILRRDTRISATSVYGHWKPKKRLGEGKYGQVVLWERNMGPYQQPMYVACKDALFDSWFQDYCTEAHLTRRLNAAGCINTVKVFDWMAVRPQKLFRILYEYCPHGSLYELYSFYKRECRVTVPEPFLWHIFHSLATVICYQAYGNTDGEPMPGWVEIVHRDIKPSNILLSDPEPNNRSLYPTIKIADYGLAYSIPNDEIRRLKRSMWTGGTQGYVAPEANFRIRDDPNQTPHPIASHLSDVYSIGCTILDFLRLPISRYSQASWELLDLELDFAYQYYPYSRALVDLARECVKPSPMDRPSAIDLYQRTQRHAEKVYVFVEELSQANHSRPDTAFGGQVLWNKAARGIYRASDRFRDAYKSANDWIFAHSHQLGQLDEAASTPRESNLPPPGHVAVGNGLGGSCKLAQLMETFAGVPVESYLAPMKVYDGLGRELARKGGEPILRFIGQDRLLAPKPNLEWKQSQAIQQPMQRKYQPRITQAGGFDRPVQGRAVNMISSFPLQPLPQGRADQLQKPLRTKELLQDQGPELDMRQRDVPPTSGPRRSRPRANVPNGGAVMEGKVKRLGSSRARQQGVLGFNSKNPFGRPNLPEPTPARRKE
ncbi:hypothetical protein MMC07_005032 [Pseudocyphellaria aurata]|nr:hypothetical protein [Pseudocyphellaria aurata]